MRRVLSNVFPFRTFLGLSVVTATSGLGLSCAATAEETELRRLAKNVELLQQNQARQASKLEDLSGRMLVLSQQAARQKAGDPGENRAQGGALEPGLPNLEVVRLGPTRRVEPNRVHDVPARQPPPPPVVERVEEDPLPHPNDDPPLELSLTGDEEPAPIPVTTMPPPPRRSSTSEAQRGRSEASRPEADPAFRAALELYGVGKLRAAHSDFAALVQKHGEADSVANTARYWMGLCKFELSDWQGALEDFQTALRHGPRHAKAADALFKSGVALEKLGDPSRARDQFARLLRDHPDSALGELARSRITQTRPSQGIGSAP